MTAAHTDDNQQHAAAGQPGGGAAPEPDPAAIVDWLEQLYDTTDTGWLTLFSVDRDTGDRHVDWHPIDDYDGLADRATTRAATCCVWLGVATRRDRLPHGRGGATDCHQLPGLWLDIDIAGPGHRTPHPLPPDIDTARQLIARFPLEPTHVVHTGGGLQAWWLFPEPLDTPADNLLARWGATWARIGHDQGWHIDNVFDVARIMRLPGTLNRKVTGDPRPVVTIETSPHRYDPTDLDDHLEDPPPPPERPPAATVPYIGPDRPGDAFNAVRHGGDLLQAAGWEMHHRDRNGDEHWTRPGKERREGSSATVYADDGHTTIWSDAVPGIEVRRPYDPFGLYTVLYHQGDFTAASDELERQGYGTKARGDDDLSWIGTAAAAAPPPVATDTPGDPDSIPGSTWGRTQLRDMLDGLVAGTLTRPQPTIGRFTGGDLALYYPGRVNGLYGESGNGKSWIALALAAETMAAGGTVAWIDLEEPAEGILARLVLDLGVDPATIAAQFLHFAPEESIRLGAALFTELDHQPPTLVVIDSTGEALTLEGAGPNNDDEVATWFRTWPRRLANRYSAAVLVIDHVVKDQTNRGLHPGGSQRKRAAITGSAFMVEPIKTLGIGTRGVLKLTCAKDRQGTHRQGHKTAEFVLDATRTPTAWHLDPPVTRDADEPFRPTHLMERVSRWLEDRAGESFSTKAIVNTVTGNKEHLNTALARLVEDGFVERRQEGQAYRHQSLKPYREPTQT